MIKRILIPLDSSVYTDAAISYGCFLARRSDAQLTGLAVLDVPGIEKSVGTLPVGGIYFADKLVAAKKDEALAHITSLVNNFKVTCEREGVSYRIAELQGNPSSQIIQESLFYDRVVTGLRTYFHCPGKAPVEGDPIDSMLAQTITPFVAVPAVLPPFPTRDKKWKILMAFNGSLPSVRAMHRFAQTSKPEEYEVKVLMAHDDEVAANYLLGRAVRYLEAHGFENVQAEFVAASKTSDTAEQFYGWADKIVLGVHSKAAFVDFMVGSLSKKLIRHGKKMLLLGQ